jgi:arylsulfatase A-like enzyme
MQGVSLVPLLSGKMKGKWRDALYYHYYEYPAEHAVRRHYGVRTDRYKLIHFYNDIDAWELYDLVEDPHEMNNLIDDPDYDKVESNLRKRLAALRKEYNVPEE